jgi:hypothetical protein
MLQKISEFDIESLNISNKNGATYLQSNYKPFELQLDWTTLGQYPLPAKMYLTEDSKSLNLTVPLERDSPAHVVLEAIDNNPPSQKGFSNRKYHKVVKAKEGNFFLRFKLYLDTALFDKDRNRISIASLHDFYRYLRDGKKVKIVFSFSKMWSMGTEYGFSLSVRRILLFDEIDEAKPEVKTQFFDTEEED